MKKIYRNLVLLACFVFIIACGDSSDTTSKEISYTQTIAETMAFIETRMTGKNIVGLSIALVDAERVLSPKLVWKTGFGFADKESGKAATEDTVYCIGSTSKTITAVALLKQMDEGNLDLDQPVAHYVPDFSLQTRYPGIGQNERITPRTLLNMHAGVPGDLYNGLFVISPPWYETYMNWLLAYLRQDYPSHEPRTVASYGNTGIVLAGHAAFLAGTDGVEADFQAFTKRTVFDPLEMTATYSEVIGKDIPELAKPYTEGVPGDPMNTNGTATGGFFRPPEG